MNQKYNMFRNYMANDLGITKEDIKEWTKEAVYEVARDYVDSNFSKFRLEEYMNKIINSSCKNVEWTKIGWKDELEKFVVSQLEKNLTSAIKQAVGEACELK